MSFRASPWISYDPSTTSPTFPMNEDIDMDAPQISTLREEETPPPPPKPHPARTSRFRVKLLVNESNASRKHVPQAEEDEDDENDNEDELEDEEDQLIDDDDDANMTAPLPLPKHLDVSPSKRKSMPKKRARKKAGGDASEIPKLQLSMGTPLGDSDQSSKSPPKKKGTSKKTAAVPKPKGKSSKAPKLLITSLEDAAVLSEAYTGTAASSPVNTPEPEPPLPLHSTEDISVTLDVPLPTYPLPSKPFPVQPPTKIGTGFAPVTPLDKSNHQVRHWRTAHREIRGIAGGRWFARAWVGEKESQFATMKAQANEAAVESTGKQTGASPGTSLPKLSKMKVSKVPTAPSVGGSSRASSTIPDPQPPHAPHATRAPTKMRTILAPESEGESEVGTVPPSEA